MTRKASDIMTPNPSCCTPGDSARDAARLMKERDCGIVPVVSDNDTPRLLGVVTDRDITMRVVEPGQDPTDVRLESIMTRDPVCCSPDTDLGDIERVMQDHQVRRVPIIDEHRNVVGVVAQADLAVRGFKEKHAVEPEELAETIERISEPTRHPGGMH